MGLLGRGAQRGQVAIVDVEGVNGRTPEFIHVDRSGQSAIGAFAARLNSAYPKLDVLVNNAEGMIGRRRLSADRIEMTLALKQLGCFLLIKVTSSISLSHPKPGGPCL